MGKSTYLKTFNYMNSPFSIPIKSEKCPDLMLDGLYIRMDTLVTLFRKGKVIFLPQIHTFFSLSNFV